MLTRAQDRSLGMLGSQWRDECRQRRRVASYREHLSVYDAPANVAEMSDEEVEVAMLKMCQEFRNRPTFADWR